ncbi:hypothetical protein BJ165DRAFT_1609267 [Panaeolus papilionaceus]|nr:hypothetical protein BJ165DRAFT_1609267 [Panaeolus papilionaceus]
MLTRKKRKTAHSTGKPEDSRPISEAHIPQELIEKIIGYLDGDKHSLKNCASVSRIFLAPCQKLIFRNVVLGPSREGSRMTLLRKIISGSPHLASFITSLRLEDAMFMGRHLQAWLKSVTTFPKFLVKLRSLKELQIQTEKAPIPWNSLSSPIRSSFDATINNGILHTLALEGISDFPLEMIPASVKVLKLFDTVPALPNSSNPPQLHIELDDFRFQCCREHAINAFANLVQAPGALLFFKQLRKFGFRTIVETTDSASRDLEAVSKVLRTASGSLTELTIDLLHPGNIPFHQPIEVLKLPFDPLKNLPCLQTLVLHVSSWLIQAGPEDSKALLWTTHMLSMVRQSSLPSLTTLRILCDSYDLGSPGRKTFEPQVWRELDSLLSSPHLNFVPNVHITIYISYSALEHFDLYADLIRRELKGLYQRGGLRLGAIFDKEECMRLRTPI